MPNLHAPSLFRGPASAATPSSVMLLWDRSSSTSVAASRTRRERLSAATKPSPRRLADRFSTDALQPPSMRASCSCSATPKPPRLQRDRLSTLRPAHLPHASSSVRQASRVASCSPLRSSSSKLAYGSSVAVANSCSSPSSASILPAGALRRLHVGRQERQQAGARRQQVGRGLPLRWNDQRCCCPAAVPCTRLMAAATMSPLPAPLTGSSGRPAGACT